jgi:hypothetical protein
MCRGFLGFPPTCNLVIVDVFFNYRGKWQAIADVCMSTQEVENILGILSLSSASTMVKNHTVAI